MTLADALDRRLPNKALELTNESVRRFHELVFDLDPDTKELRRSPGVRLVAKISPLLLMAYGFSYGTIFPGENPVGLALAALAQGFTLSTMMEYLTHRYVMHAPLSRIRWFEKNQTNKYSGWLFAAGARLARSHLVHHLILSRDHYTTFPEFAPAEATEGLPSERRLWTAEGRIQFSGLEEEARYLRHIGMAPAEIAESLDRLANERLAEGDVRDGHGYSDNEVVAFEKTGFGVLMEQKSYRKTMIFFSVLGFGTEMALRGNYLYLPFTLASVALAPHVDLMHGKMHHPRAEFETEPSGAGNMKRDFIRWFLASPYFRSISRIHFGHHDHWNKDFAILPLNWDGLFGTDSQPDLDRAIRALQLDLYM